MTPYVSYLGQLEMDRFCRGLFGLIFSGNTCFWPKQGLEDVGGRTEKEFSTKAEPALGVAVGTLNG